MRPLAAAIFGLALWFGAAAAQPAMPVIAELGPWPAITGLIGYRGRLWLVNSKIGINHNSADIYSYAPGDAAPRYESHLFSQDAGAPMIAGGLLYWPFEDPRVTLGVGHYMVTDGRRWQLGTIETSLMFHVHAMAPYRGGLLAATSAWRAGLQVLDDGGAGWREIYRHPTPERRISRITRLAVVGDKVIGRVRDPTGEAILVLDDAGVAPIKGWPADAKLVDWAVHQGALSLLIRRDDGYEIRRTDGAGLSAPERLAIDGRARALASDGETLWLATSDTVWQQAAPGDWQAVWRLAGGAPRDLAVTAGTVFVSGMGDGGSGILWGAALDWPPPAPSPAPPEMPQPQALPASSDWAAAAAELDRMLADPARYEFRDRTLVALVRRLALARPPRGFWRDRFAAPVPAQPVERIGGRIEITARAAARWVLLWGTALSRRAEVPLDTLSVPWTAPPNRSEKYFDAPPLALWAAALAGQSDRATLDRIVGRLAMPGDPLWLTGDVVGALSALTGQRFGYDREAWQNWWASARGDWPQR